MGTREEGKEQLALLHQPSFSAGASQAIPSEHQADANASWCSQIRSDKGGPQVQGDPGLVGLPHYQELGLHFQHLPTGEGQPNPEWHGAVVWW